MPTPLQDALEEMRIAGIKLRAENERLRAALMDLMNEHPTRSDAMAKAAQVLNSH